MITAQLFAVHMKYLHNHRAKINKKKASKCLTEFTNGILWRQVNCVSVEVLQEGPVHHVGELMDFDGFLIRLI